MRTLLVVLAVALLAIPAGLAQSGGPDPERQRRDPDERRGPDDRPRPASPDNGRPCEGTECADFCERNPEDRRCRACHPSGEDRNEAREGNQTSPDTNATAPDEGRRPACPPPPCEAPCPLPCDRPQAPRCAPRPPLVFGDEPRRHITFTPDPANQTLRDYRVGGQLVLESLRVDADTDLVVERHGRVLRIAGEDVLLELHDNPTGLVRFRGANATVTLDFPDDAQPVEPGLTTRIRYPGGAESFLNAHSATWHTGTVTVEVDQFFVFHMAERPEPASQQPRPSQDRLRPHLEDAADEGRLGAQVTVRRPADVVGNGVTVATATEDAVDIVPYGDVNVTVVLPPASDPATPLRVVVSAELDEGRTIALDVAPDVIEFSEPRDLLLRYFDVHDDGTETEVVFRQATSLADVLDPTDDGGQPEYWVVSDASGLHILVTVPHWSTHAITVASIGSFVAEPSVLVGIGAGVAGSVVAAALVLWPRRRRDA